jgi:hypothetical protein
MLAGATPAIDAHTSHEAALGERWLTFRLPELSTERARNRTRFAVERTSARQHRDAARALAADAVHAARTRIPTRLGDPATNALVDVAHFVAVARTGVSFEGQGRYRVIVEPPTPEEPTRLAGQLVRLARCLVALGCTELDAVRIAARAGLDSLPPTREKTLRTLFEVGEVGANVSDVRAGMGRGNRFAALWALESLEAVGMVDVEGAPRDEDPKAVRIYRLRDEWSAAARKVYEVVACTLSQLSVIGGEATHAYTSNGAPAQGLEQVDEDEDGPSAEDLAYWQDEFPAVTVDHGWPESP